MASNAPITPTAGDQSDIPMPSALDPPRGPAHRGRTSARGRRRPPVRSVPPTRLSSSDDSESDTDELALASKEMVIQEQLISDLTVLIDSNVSSQHRQAQAERERRFPPSRGRPSTSGVSSQPRDIVPSETEPNPMAGLSCPSNSPSNSGML